jgi:AraC-like DNA-binding protein
MSVGQLANFAGEILAQSSDTIAILLQQPAPPTAARQRFGKGLVAVSFDVGCDGVLVSAKRFENAPHNDPEVLRRHFEEYAQLLKMRYPDSLQDQVRDIIGQALPSGECSLERVAATLELHPRVLQKRLQQEGSSYVKLLQDTRLTIAREHLRVGSMSITDLALNLGYADVSVFSRNFRRLTGMSARQWQQATAGGATAIRGRS